MFVPYKCCQKSFEDYYTRQSGHGLDYYQGTALKKGLWIRTLVSIAFSCSGTPLQVGGESSWQSIIS